MLQLFNTQDGQITDVQGRPYPDCLIIDRPDLKSMPLILGEGVLTILFWGFWFYLWLPMISLLAWWFGLQIFYSQMVSLGGFEGFVEQLYIFTSGIGLVSGILITWSFYNFRRYGSYGRRTNLLETDTSQLSMTFKIVGPKLAKIQQAKRVSFSFDQNDAIRKVDICLEQPCKKADLNAKQEAISTA